MGPLVLGAVTLGGYKGAPDISRQPALCHSSTKLSQPISVTNFLTDQTKVLYFKKGKSFKKIRSWIDSEESASLENRLPKSFGRRFVLPDPG